MYSSAWSGNILLTYFRHLSKKKNETINAMAYLFNGKKKKLIISTILL